MYLAQPKADWDTLAVGNVIVSKGRAWRITHIPPKRGFVLATNVMSGEAEKLLRSNYDNDDLLVTDEATLATLRTVHQEEIEKAMARASLSPARPIRLSRTFHAVSCILGRKAAGKGPRTWRRINEMRAFHDRQQGPGWQFRKVDDLKADRPKETFQVGGIPCECEAGVGIKKPEAIPRLVASVNETISELRERIEILDHLRRHLEKTVRTDFVTARGVAWRLKSDYVWAWYTVFLRQEWELNFSDSTSIGKYVARSVLSGAKRTNENNHEQLPHISG